MKYFLAVFAFLMIANCAARAGDFATVAFGPSLDGTTNPKEFALGFEKTWGEFGLYTHCGLLFENETNGYCAALPGVHIETTSGIFARAGFGPAWVVNENERLTSHFNFNIDFTIGVYQGPVFFAAELGHLSNAGLWGANLGDDHLLAEIGVAL